MPEATEVTGIVDKVRSALKEAEQDGVYLKVTGDSLDDGWLYIVVEPARPGVRGYDHATLMSRIERKLRAEGNDKILLVPALED